MRPLDILFIKVCGNFSSLHTVANSYEDCTEWITYWRKLWFCTLVSKLGFMRTYKYTLLVHTCPLHMLIIEHFSPGAEFVACMKICVKLCSMLQL